MLCCPPMRFQVVTLVLATMVASAEARAADDPLLQQFMQSESLQSPNHGFLAPTGRFRVRLPSNFTLQESSEDDNLIFTGEIGGVDAALIVRRIDVTPGASSSQLMLTTRDRFLTKLPHFAVMRQGSVKIAGRPCAQLIGRYDYQGNKGYPQIIENAYVVDGSDGYIIHMEIPEGLYKAMAKELIDVYKSFKLVPVKAAPSP
jgi:hypothetical protein